MQEMMGVPLRVKMIGTGISVRIADGKIAEVDEPE